MQVWSLKILEQQRILSLSERYSNSSKSLSKQLKSEKTRCGSSCKPKRLNLRKQCQLVSKSKRVWPCLVWSRNYPFSSAKSSSRKLLLISILASCVTAWGKFQTFSNWANNKKSNIWSTKATKQKVKTPDQSKRRRIRFANRLFKFSKKSLSLLELQAKRWRKVKSRKTKNKQTSRTSHSTLFSALMLSV